MNREEIDMLREGEMKQNQRGQEQMSWNMKNSSFFGRERDGM